MSFQSAKEASGSSNREAKGFLLLIAVLVTPFLLQYSYRWLFYKPQPLDLQVTYLSDTCETKKTYTNYNTSSAAGYATNYTASYPKKSVGATQVKYSSVDINTADSVALEALPGIGPAFASRIIKYRTLLGGYVKLEQLKEVYGMPPETYDRIKPSCTLSTAKVKKIPADSLWLKPYKYYHPYLSKELKASITTKKKTTDYSQAVLQDLVDASNEKLGWYLSW
jgi:competence protein ComEA